MKPIVRTLALIVPLIAAVSGCATSRMLTASAERPIMNQSVVSPKLKERKIRKLMVIPPSGTARGQFEMQIVLFEREFLKRGITVITGAITGRVVLEATQQGSEKKTETAQELSDMERALVMAEKTGADAILQIGQFTWSGEDKNTRFFVSLIAPNSPFEEVDQKKFNSWSGPKVALDGPELSFVGRLVDVSNGEVIASFDMRLPANFCIPGDYQAVYTMEQGATSGYVSREPAFKYKNSWMEVVNGQYKWFYSNPWMKDSKEIAESRLIEAVAATISQQ